MENQELLNPNAEKSNKQQGVENLPVNVEIEQIADEQPKPTDVEKKASEELSEMPVNQSENVNGEQEKVENPAAIAENNEMVEQTETVTGGSEPIMQHEVAAETTQTVQEIISDQKPRKSKAAKETINETEIQAEEQHHPEHEEDAEPDEIDDEHDTLIERYNTLSKAELIEAIEALVTNDDIVYIRKHIGHIKLAFRNLQKEHSVHAYEKTIADTDEHPDETHEIKPVDELAERFEKAFGIYKDKKNLYDQAVEKQKSENLKIKEAILEEIRNLIESEEELKKTYDLFKDLQEKWREVGPVPQNSKNTLWNNYHFLVEKFFDKVKINKELRDLDLRKNLEAKAELCEKAEELLLEPSINKSFQKLQKLHEAWKEIGPVPKDKKDEIWDRFKTASDAVNDRRQSYYDSLRDEQNKNLTAKVLLCEQAEQLSDFTTDSPRKWQEATEKVNELFKAWKSVGFAPKKINDDVWVRFRSALDGFFNNKKEFFGKFKDEQTENYNQKLNLCLQAEALKDSEDWKRTTDELIILQQQWKKIGPVPKKFSDRVWKRFRTACDAFFNRKSEYFSNIGDKQEDNLKKKKDLIEQLKSFEFSANSNENLNILKDFQRQWMEIGHVPIKEKDKLQNEFRKLVNEHFDKLNISRQAKSAMGFKSKIESLKNSPNAGNIIYKERNFLINRINSLQNDIKLWENNIGFFAASKKADVLKIEFEKKIEKAKADIAVMEEKLKILNAS